MKLSDTQLVILTAAAQRSNLLAVPLPQNLKGGAAQKVVASLLKQGLLEEIDADTRSGEPVWRKTGDGHGVTLAITEQGLAAIGIEPENAHPAPSDATQPDTSAESGHAAKARTRTDSKQAKLIEMLRRPEGASIEEIVVAFGWQALNRPGFVGGPND